MGSFPFESGVWLQLGNQGVGCKGVCLDVTTAGTQTGGNHPWLPLDSLGLNTTAKPHRQTLSQVKGPFLFWTLHFKNPFNTFPRFSSSQLEQRLQSSPDSGKSKIETLRRLGVLADFSLPGRECLSPFFVR